MQVRPVVELPVQVGRGVWVESPRHAGLARCSVVRLFRIAHAAILRPALAVKSPMRPRMCYGTRSFALATAERPVTCDKMGDESPAPAEKIVARAPKYPSRSLVVHPEIFTIVTAMTPNHAASFAVRRSDTMRGCWFTTRPTLAVARRAGSPRSHATHRGHALVASTLAAQWFAGQHAIPASNRRAFLGKRASRTLGL